MDKNPPKDSLDVLIDFSNSIASLQKELGFGEVHGNRSDARGVVLSGLYKTVCSLGFIFHSIYMVERKQFSPSEYIRLIGLCATGGTPANAHHLRNALDRLEVTGLKSLLVMYQFYIDHLFRELASSLSRGEEKFKPNVCNVLKELELDKLEQQILFAAYVRNTLHSNGLHKWPDTQLTFENRNLFLRQSEPFDISLPNLIFVLRASFAAVSEVLRNEKVCDIKYIADVAAEQALL